MPELTEHDEILGITQAAKLAKKLVSTMYWLRSTGQGPRSGKLGRKVIYRRSDVLACIERVRGGRSVTARNCTVCSDPSVCQAHGWLYPETTLGDWATKPVSTELRCRVESDGPAAVLYRALIRLAERQGVTVAELMGGAE